MDCVLVPPSFLPSFIPSLSKDPETQTPPATDRRGGGTQVCVTRGCAVLGRVAALRRLPIPPAGHLALRPIYRRPFLRSEMFSPSPSSAPRELTVPAVARFGEELRRVQRCYGRMGCGDVHIVTLASSHNAHVSELYVSRCPVSSSACRSTTRPWM